ncbi:ABC transporter ATP-binding protein [Halobacillus sp. SY10]|uniref:ABC transporter ATP-binding protein n=1 Tax=Halobacillus sp. SY10 TaxID=3381356 RepID=UPI00387A0E0B
MSMLNFKGWTSYFSFYDIKRTFFLLAPYIKRHKAPYIWLFVLMFVDIALVIALAWFFGNIIDSAIQSDFSRLRTMIFAGIGISVVSMSVNFIDTLFETKALNAVKRDLNVDLYSHVLKMNGKDFSHYHSGELMSHFTNDLHQIDGVIGRGLINLVRLPLIACAALIYIIHINWTLSLLVLLVAPFAVLGGILFGFLLKNNSRKIHGLISGITKTLNETFQGMTVIRSFTLEQLFLKNYKKKNDNLYDLEMKDAKLRGWFYTGGEAVGTITFLVSVLVGAFFVTDQVLTVGALLTFINLVNHLVYPMTGLAGQWAGYQRSASALERVLHLLDRAQETSGTAKPLISHSPHHPISFHNVVFSYDGKSNVIRDMNLDLPMGKLTAIVGPSGAGKSTMFQLLQGFYKPTSGSIHLNGLSIDQMNLAEWRQLIAYVPQESFLFSGSLKENLIYARPDVTQTEMIQAAKAANIHDFIESLPKGYDTEIGERGIKLSGGQKQRVAIARAFLKDAPLLLLDEATSSLDHETEFLVKEALDRLMVGRTTLVIAHRLSTIRHADHMVVLDKGEVVQQGNHEQLIAEDGLYRNLYEKQFFVKEGHALKVHA